MILNRWLLASAAVSVLAAGVPALAQEKSAPIRLTFSAAPSISSIYAACAAITSFWEKSLPGTAITVTEGGTVSNIVRLQKGQAQMAYSKPASLRAARKGGSAPFNEPVQNVVAVAGMASGPLHIVIDKSSGITSFDQIVDRKYPLKISAGRKGYSSEVFLTQILEIYGLNYDSIAKWGGEVRLVDMGAGIAAMQDGQLNAAITPDILPHPGVTQIAEARAVNIVALPPDVIEKLVSRYGYVATTIPAGTYKGMNASVTTVDDPYILIARDDVPAAFVESAVRALFTPEGRKYVSAVSAQLGKVTAKEAVEMVGDNKFHPGAAAYFRKEGLLK